MQWYYAVNGQQQGPVEQEELTALARNGSLKPGDLVWNASMGSQWAKASTVPGLFETPPGVPPPIMTPRPLETGAGPFTSSTPNRDLMRSAREALSGNWGIAIGGVLVFLLLMVVMAFIPVLNGILSLVLTGPLMVGWFGFFLVLSRREQAGIGMLFDGFKGFANAFLAYVLMGLLVTAWALPGIVLAIITAISCGVSMVKGGTPNVGLLLLLIPLILVALIPAMIAQYRYFMTYLILHENPGTGPLEAIRQSTQMMAGNKWKLFCMQWRFVGWILLCYLTLGIGFLWLVPYMMTSLAAFYEDLKEGRESAV